MREADDMPRALYISLFLVIIGILHDFLKQEG